MEHSAGDIVPDGEEGKCAAGESDYDLTLLDLNLPRLDGLSVFRCVRLKKPSFPMLMGVGQSRVSQIHTHAVKRLWAVT